MPPLLSNVSVNNIVRYTAAAAGVSVAIAGGYFFGYRLYYHYSPRQREERLLHIAALTLSNQVVHKTLNDRDLQNELGRFAIQVIKQPAVSSALKQYFKEQLFTTDTPTRAALTHFIVQNVLDDAWVRQELINVAKEIAENVKNDKQVYPDAVVKLLADGVQQSVQQPQAQDAFFKSVQNVLWDAIIGPPELDTSFTAINKDK